MIWGRGSAPDVGRKWERREECVVGGVQELNIKFAVFLKLDTLTGFVLSAG